MALNVSTDRRLVRAGSRSIRYLTVGYTAVDAPRRTERLPLDIAIVIDKSGSMAGSKLELAKVAARRAVELLSPRDHVALVAYDSEVELLAAGALLAAGHRAELLRSIDRLQAGTMTNLSGGWLTGCQQVASSGREHSVARTLLLSDGLANQGITDRDELQRHAQELRTRGVVTSCFGIGNDFDERLMEGMARAGGGNFYYLERAEQIPDYLASELGEALEVVARGVTLDVEADPGIEIGTLEQRPLSHDGNRTRILLGDLVSRQQVETVVRVTFPRRDPGALLGVRVRLSDVDLKLDEASVAIDWEVADHHANDRQPRDSAVDIVVAGRYAAKARNAAAEHNRAGNLEAARQELIATARRIRQYAGSNPELREVADQLEQEARRHEEVFSPSMLKHELAMNYYAREGKQADGRKRRSPMV
ncbi:MAG: VWA domain-containing protein [Gemmatimonadota bacterium]|nr:VWA domain-containing protein [Gemmatimonadota bacterium]